MRAIGEVVTVDGETATVRFKRARACKGCKGCISAGENEALVALANTLDARVGDHVEISLHARSVLRAVAVAYVFPLLALLCGLFIGLMLSEVWGVVFGIAFALAAYGVIWLLEPRRARKGVFKPHMVGFKTD